jgi:CIC family chloride channel protein
VPQILEALALRRGRIRPRVGLFGILAPAITIGADGSVGREGPIALIGAAFGSSVGQLLRLGDQYTSLLVACGAAAGIGATFNAPIAGALFGMEVVLGSYGMGTLVPVFVASVTGVTVFRSILGNRLVLPAPDYQFNHPLSLLLMLLLGVAAGGVALAYTYGLDFVEEFSQGWHVHWAWQAVCGGLLIGLLGLALPQILGVGYATMQHAVDGSLGLWLLLGLLAGKYVATLVTIGSGGSGGVFAPSLYLGVTLGGAFGILVHVLDPSLAPATALYAVAGMGAVFAGAARAPLTASVIILEMTGDYHLTVGVMAACGISYLVQGSLARDSMYTVKLSRHGVRILRGTDVRPLQRVPLSAALRPLGERLFVDEPARLAMTRLRTENQRALPVFRRDGSFAGIVEDQRLLEAVSGNLLDAPVGRLARTVGTLPPSLTLDDAMRRFALQELEVLPVGTDATHVVGTVSRDDVLRVYYNRTVVTLETQHRVELLQEAQGGDNGTFRQVHLPPEWPASGAHVSTLGLPAGAVVVVVHRAQAVLVPRGETTLQSGDDVLLYAGTPDVAAQAEQQLLAGRLRNQAVAERVTLQAGALGVGHRVRELGLPPGALLSALEREDRMVIPTADTELAAGDVVTVRAADAAVLAAATHRLTDPPPRPS